MIKQLNEAETSAVNGAGLGGYLVGYGAGIIAGQSHEDAKETGQKVSDLEDTVRDLTGG